MRLIVIRHAQTHDNVNRMMTGQKDSSLTELGIRQANLLGARLKEEAIDRIFASDLGRVRSTTDCIARYHTCGVNYRKDLRERAYGQFENGTIKVYRTARDSSGINSYDFKPSGGESAHDLESRITSFLKLLNIFNKSTILISAHSDINRMIFQILLNLPHDECKEITQNNACVNVFEGDSIFGMICILKNDIHHLSDFSSNN